MAGIGDCPALSNSSSVISCLLAPDGGEVRLRGEPVRPSDRRVRHLIGVVPQELAIYGELTARENLSFFGELYGVKGAELKRRVQRVLAAVGLEDRADDGIRSLCRRKQLSANVRRDESQDRRARGNEVVAHVGSLLTAVALCGCNPREPPCKPRTPHSATLCRRLAHRGD